MLILVDDVYVGERVELGSHARPFAITERSTHAGREVVRRAAAERMARHFEIVDTPALEGAEADVFQAHRDLLRLTVRTAFALSRTTTWRYKRRAFDYTVGPGLGFLADEHGIDRLLYLSASRDEFDAAAAAAAEIDVRSGRLVWFDAEVPFYTDPGDDRGARAFITELMGHYPRSKYIRGYAWTSR